MNPVTPELLARLLDAQADALELFAAQWSRAPADAVQEAFVELARQPALPENPEAWLFKVVRNRAISEARSADRRRRRESTASLRQTRELVGDEESGLDPLDATRALAALSEELREILVARIWGRLTFEQIADMTGISTSTAYRRYDQALRNLREELGIPCPQPKATPTP